jgi:putative transposase
MAGSLREGLEETLTVMRLDLPERPEARALIEQPANNLIENLFSRVRAVARRVNCLQRGMMILRWTGASVPQGCRI